MKPRTLLVVLIASLACYLAAAAAPSNAGDEWRDGRLSARFIGKPLPEILRSLPAREVSLSASPGLQGAKASVIVRDERLGEVMDRLAEVFGGEWVRLPGEAPIRLELRRTRPVLEWLTAWRAARGDAEQTARKAQATIVRENMERALAALDRPLPRNDEGKEVPPPDVVSVPLARVVRAFSGQDRQRLADHIAAISPVRSGGMAAALPPPLLVRVSDLGPEQQAQLRAWLTAQGHTAIYEQRLRDLSDTLVEFGSHRGVSVEVVFHPPNGGRPYSSAATTGAKTAAGLESILHSDLYRRLAARKTPAGALLGASLMSAGKVQPPVRIEDAKLAGRRQELPDNLLSAELLAQLADASGLNLVADYHTRSARLPLGGVEPKVEKVMAAAAERFELVLRQEGRFLLARNRWWPDRDEEETPAPHPERWIGLKKAGEILLLEDLATMGGLSDARLAGLAAYRDGKADFRPEVELARKDRWVWGLVGSFTDAQRKAARSAEGLPIRQLYPRQRAFLVRSAGAQVPWDQVRLYVHSWEKPKPGKTPSFAGAELKVPGTSASLWSTLLQPPYGFPEGKR